MCAELVLLELCQWVFRPGDVNGTELTTVGVPPPTGLGDMTKWRSKSHRGTKKHVHAHTEVINNEHWYGDEPPSLGRSFSAKKTAERHQEIVQILGRVAKRAAKAGEKSLAQAYDGLADKLEDCRPRRRCGSLACPKCARAIHKAKVAAQSQVDQEAGKGSPEQERW